MDWFKYKYKHLTNTELLDHSFQRWSALKIDYRNKHKTFCVVRKMLSRWIQILLQPVLCQGFIFSIQQLSNELAGIESFLCGSFSQSLVIILIADCFWSKNLFFSIFLLPGDQEDHIAGFVKFEIVKVLCDRFFWLFLSRECEMWSRSPTAPWRWWWWWWW